MDEEYTHIEWQSILGLVKMKRFSRHNHRYKRQTRKSQFQINVLNYVFEVTKFPSTTTIIDLALLINCHPKSIQKWFQNTRQLTKKKTPIVNVVDTSTIDLSVSTLYTFVQKIKRKYVLSD